LGQKAILIAEGRYLRDEEVFGGKNEVMRVILRSAASSSRFQEVLFPASESLKSSLANGLALLGAKIDMGRLPDLFGMR
jgi:hypothetical protein